MNSNKTNKILSDNLLSARQYAEYYSGLYFSHCDTLEETKNCLASENIWISDGLKLSELTQLEHLDNAYFVLVEFSLPDDYTQHEIRLMRVQKRYLSRFLRNMIADA